MKENRFHIECNNCYRRGQPDAYEACGVYWDRPQDDKESCPLYDPRPTVEEQLKNLGIVP